MKQQASEAGQFNNIVRELTNAEEEQQGNDETSFDNNAAKLNNIETEVQDQDGQSDNLVRDFNTGNLVKQFDETDEQASQDAQFNNNVEELTEDEEEEDEDEDEDEEEEEEVIILLFENNK